MSEIMDLSDAFADAVVTYTMECDQVIYPNEFPVEKARAELAAAVSAQEAEIEKLRADAAGAKKVTQQMVQAAAEEWDEWASDNRGTYECFEAILRAAITKEATNVHA